MKVGDVIKKFLDIYGTQQEVSMVMKQFFNYT